MNFVNGEYFFDDINPTVTLKATDASSDTVIITCEVGGVVKNITPSYRPFDDSDKRAYIITGDEIEVNITDDLAAGEYNTFNRIEFIPMDTSGNIGNSARTFQVEDAAILDPGYATFSGATVADSNFYIDVYFNEGVYGDENAQTGLSDNALIIGIIVPFNGTATAISIDSLKNYTGAELIGGEDTIRVFLNVTGTPNGLENIEIFATSNSTVFDQSGTFTPATYSMSQAVGGRYLRDLTSPALELIDISGNTVAGMKYVAVNTPTLTITAEDAKSIEVDALSLTCTVNGNPVIINPIVITSEVATVIEFVTELSDTVFTFGDIIFTVTDTAGNSTTLSPATFTLDTGDPANPEIGSLSTIVNSVAGWWNADNVAIDITVILPTDSTLLGGTIQLKAKVGSGDYEDLGSSVDIQINDFNDLDGNGIWNSDEPLDTITTTIIATEVDPLVGIEEINGFAEDVVITISAVIFDRATNPNIEIVTADIDSYGELINVDQVDPAAATVGAITSFSNDPVNSTSVDYYWNMDTDTITVTIDLPEDESLEGGSVQLKGKIGLSNFVNLGTLSSISANEFGDGELELKTITVPDSITGLDNGVEDLVADFTAQDLSLIHI